MSAPAHNVQVVIADKVIERWLSYEIELDMLEPADAFSLSRPFDRAAWELCAGDAPIQVYVDDTPILSGFIEGRRKRSDREGAMLEVIGRDKGGRLVDESAPLLRFDGFGILQLAEDLVGDWFPSVSLSNARNRALMRGRAASKAPAGSEPPIDTSRFAKKKVEPGETRWQVLAHYLELASLLAWSSADGREFILGKPNYNQAPQYRFFQAAAGSDRAGDTNAVIDVEESTAERYSLITACGSNRGDSANYGDRVTRLRATVRNNPARPDGTGKDFASRKSLLVADDDVDSLQEARERAQREFDEREATREILSVQVPGHAQLRAGRVPALFAFDTVAEVEDEETGIRGAYLVTRVTFRADRQGGETTGLRLVPKGTALRL